MLVGSIRLVLLLTTLAASLHVAAAPRFWTLTGGSPVAVGHFIATGYFSYDDVTQTISSWNLHVVGVFPNVIVPNFWYVPGNSIATVTQASGAAAPTLSFSAAIDAPDVVVGVYPSFGIRQLQIAPLTALDSSNATVPLDTSLSTEEFPSLGRGRSTTAGALMLTPVPPPVVVVQVDEFYNSALRHYFITADGAEKQALDTGVRPGWQRTGESFKAYAKGSNTGDAINPVCRFYSPPILESDFGDTPGSDSHFFSADAGECLTVFHRYDNGLWQLEDENVFQITLPDKVTGACPVGTIPVYRLWNQRPDSNHRYTTSAAIKAQMLAAGYLAEGYGADGVVMCAVQ